MARRLPITKTTADLTLQITLTRVVDQIMAAGRYTPSFSCVNANTGSSTVFPPNTGLSSAQLSVTYQVKVNQ